MTTTDNRQREDLVSLKIDGVDVAVPKGTLIIRAAEKVGIRIPRFCDHPLLKPAGACRQCLVEVAMPDREGNVRKMPKPQPSCAMTVAPGMEVYTQDTSEVAEKAQHGIMEFLLINHPLDCPVCDKGGECPLQNQAMTDGRTTSRFVDIKRTYPKPISVSSQILLDRDRCILCQRCTRFSTQIAGDAFIQLQGRGGGTPGMGVHALNGSQIGNFDASILNFATEDGDTCHTPTSYVGPFGEAGRAEGFASGPVTEAEKDVTGRPFASYFSGNTIQICPVGALTSADYRFRARPFDLVSVPSVAEHDASGSALRIDYRRGTILRRLAGEDMDVNEEWITDKDRFAFHWQKNADRLTQPLLRTEGTEREVSWFEGIEAAAQALKGKKVGVLVGGRLPLEDAFAYSKFARVVLGTNDIDFRTRQVTEEENAFLAACVAGTGLGVTYGDLEKAGHVLTVGFEAEEECGTVFLRLRKGVLAKSTSVTVVSAFSTAGTAKMEARFIPAAPGTEAAVLDAIADGAAFADTYVDLQKDGSVILVGERAADCPGALSAAVRLAERTGARLAWIPRRAGDRGAVEAGALGTLLPGGRPVADSAARVDVAAAWGVESLPSIPGRSVEGMLVAAANGELDALLVAGVELEDLPGDARTALERATVVQLEVRRTSITDVADVVLPVAPPVEKGGTFVNWEGRMRPFGQVLTSTYAPDRIALNDIATAMGISLGLASLADVVRGVKELGTWDGARPAAPAVPAGSAPAVREGQAVLASWHLMLDAGALQSYEAHLGGTARRAVAFLSEATVRANGLGSEVTICGADGEITLPVFTATMPDGVVWIPENSVGCRRSDLGVVPGQVVSIRPSKAEVAQ